MALAEFEPSTLHELINRGWVLPREKRPKPRKKRGRPRLDDAFYEELYRRYQELVRLQGRGVYATMAKERGCSAATIRSQIRRYREDTDAA